ncbi:MAG TPA: class I SAM-dependent methyltransferase, partial [Pseudomonadota bacterium]|nr:class I SAM-dependent methyltransferase [Pseudomonadota bacterium]
YDGRTVLEPSDELDRDMLAAFHAHQRTDKGFGPALGPSAAARAAERFEQVGYAVMQGRSDWVLRAVDLAIQEALFAGWAEAETTSAALSSERVSAWLARRRSYLAAGRSRLRVGHVDIFARPMGAR